MQLLKMPSLKYATCDGKICRDSGSYTYWESVSANYKCARAYFCGCPELKCIGQSRYSIQPGKRISILLQGTSSQSDKDKILACLWFSDSHFLSVSRTVICWDDLSLIQRLWTPRTAVKSSTDGCIQHLSGSSLSFLAVNICMTRVTCVGFEIMSWFHCGQRSWKSKAWLISAQCLFMLLS